MRNTFEQIRAELMDLGLPPGDSCEPGPSKLRFEDGASYRIEIPTINTLQALDALLDESIKIGLMINRITETLGICRHTRDEISRYVQLCRQYGCQLLMSPGPRAAYDLGVSAKTSQGGFAGYRLRGQDQLVYAISDVLRAMDLGVSGFVIYDEGMLRVLSVWKKIGKLPDNIQLKVSAHCGHGNPASMKLMEELGAGSVNPIRDLPLGHLHAIRQTISIPLDCHVDTPASSGGIMRFYDAPAMVETLAPVHLKTGNSLLPQHGYILTNDQARAIARQALAVTEIVQEHAPLCTQSETKAWMQGSIK